MDIDEQVATVALSRIPGIGGATLRRLIVRFGSALGAFEANDVELLQVARVTSATLEAVRGAVATFDSIRDELFALDDAGISVLAWDAFPPNLRAAGDAPALLYMRGQLIEVDNLAIAVVGSRDPSEDGLQVASIISAALAERCVTIVSGLAMGIDGAAHRSALEAGGRSVGVLGCGICRMFPPENGDIADAIVNRGAIVSELEPMMSVNPKQLMMRDRIISGLSLAVIVVEAAAEGGTMDTAERARKQGRAVIAVDWDGNSPHTAGNRRLMRSGAFPIAADASADWEEILRRCDEVALNLDRNVTESSQPRLF